MTDMARPGRTNNSLWDKVKVIIHISVSLSHKSCMIDDHSSD